MWAAGWGKIAQVWRDEFMLMAITRAVSETLGRCELTHRERMPIDVARAAAQHAAYEEAVRSVGFEAGDLGAYQVEGLRDGVNRLASGEEIFYISNPALGLWALKRQFPGA